MSSFGYGPRACIGRKFSIVESVYFLTLLLRDWRVDIVPEEGETREEWRERVLGAWVELALSFGKIPVVLRRRAS